MSRVKGQIGWVKMVVWLGCICFLVCGAPKPTLAAFNPTFKGKEGFINLAGWSLGLAALSWTARYMHKNSPAARSEGYPEELGEGEWFFAGYFGYSYLPNTDWQFTQNDTHNLTGVVAKDISYKPGVMGGLKFGRYFDRAPWFGMEVETRFSRNNIPGQQGTITPPQPFQPSPALKGSDWFMIWAIQVNLLARYGFLKDKEVTFGRLQPYIGIGTGFNIDYGKYDSTKNFALETQAGLKYMMNKTVGVFVEYKFTYQWAIEYQDVPIRNSLPNYPINALPANYTFTFDQPHHMVVMGVAFHFKNLYGG
jgi:Outer membrane protein beta-barrel domain